MSESIGITTIRSGRIAVVHARGRVDARTSHQFLDHCRKARIQGGHLVLNLADVSFLSSSGVGALLVIAQECIGDGGHLRLAPPSIPVRAAIDLLHLGRFLTIDASEDEAIAALEA